MVSWQESLWWAARPAAMCHEATVPRVVTHLCWTRDRVSSGTWKLMAVQLQLVPYKLMVLQLHPPVPELSTSEASRSFLMWYRKTKGPFGTFLFRALLFSLSDPHPAAWLQGSYGRVFWTDDTFVLLQLLLFSLLSPLNHVFLWSQLSPYENYNHALADSVWQ